MDKSTRALYASADNAAAIEALLYASSNNAAAIEALRAELNRGIGIKMRVVEGVRSGLNTSFGEVTSKTRAGVIVAYSGSGAVLFFNGVEMKSGASPIFAVLPVGTGELTLRGNCTNSRAFIIET